MSRENRSDSNYQRVDKRIAFTANVGTGKPSKVTLKAPDGTLVACEKCVPVTKSMTRTADGVTISRRAYKEQRALAKSLKRKINGSR